MCHNPETHSRTYGKKYKIKDLIVNLSSDDNDITISGGDSLTYQIRETYEVVKELKLKYNKNIWLYTGFKFEQLLADCNPIRQEILKYIDVLVDGKFDYSKANNDLIFKGDSSQRIIDVKNSLEKNEVVLWKSKYI